MVEQGRAMVEASSKGRRGGGDMVEREASSKSSVALPRWRVMVEQGHDGVVA